MLKGGYLYQDVPVGIICLESSFAKPKGHLRNHYTFNFPTVHKVLKNIDIPRLLFNPTPDLMQPFIDAAKELEAEGVKAITGSCGFMARFQQEIAAEVNIPVLVSSLVQAPMVRTMHGKDANIGILTASNKALTEAHFKGVNSDINDFVIKGMEGYDYFWNTIIEGRNDDIDMDRMEDEICDAAVTLVKEHSLDALILECTDLPAFSHAVHKRIGLPVYDINALIEYAAFCVRRPDYRK